MCNQLKVVALPSNLDKVSEGGYALFVKWLQHFDAIKCRNVERKVLLLVDGHSTHSENLDALALTRSC